MDTKHLVREIFPLFRALRHLGDLGVEPSKRQEGPHVIILPGYGAVPHLYRDLQLYLEQKGFRAHLADVGVNVKKLKESMDITLKESRKLVGDEPCQIVGHSLGGGIGAAMLALSSMTRQIKRVVTLGTPFLGCSWGPLRRLVIETTGISEKTFEDNREAFLSVSDRIVSISSEEDQIASPDRCLIPGSNMKSIVLSKKLGIGHAHMMGGHPVVRKLVSKMLLKEASF